MDYRIDHSRLYIENPQINPNPPIILHSGAAHFFHKIFQAILKIFPGIAKKDPFSHKSAFGSFKVKLGEHIYYVNKKSYMEWRSKTTAEIPFEGSYAKDLIKIVQTNASAEKTNTPQALPTQIYPDSSNNEKADELKSKESLSSEENLPSLQPLDLENYEVWLQPNNKEAFRRIDKYTLLEALQKKPLNFWMKVSDQIEDNLSSKQVAFEETNPLLDVLLECENNEKDAFSSTFAQLPTDNASRLYTALFTQTSVSITDRLSWLNAAYERKSTEDKALLIWMVFHLCKKIKSEDFWKSLDDAHQKFAVQAFFEPCILGILKYSDNSVQDFQVLSKVQAFINALPLRTKPSPFFEKHLSEEEKIRLLKAIYLLRKTNYSFKNVEFMNLKQPSYAGGDLLQLVSQTYDFNEIGSKALGYLKEAYKDYTSRTEERMRFSFDLLQAIFKREKDINKIGACFRELNIYKVIDSYATVIPIFIRDCMVVALKEHQKDDGYKNILSYLKNNLKDGSSEILGLFNPNVEDEALNQMLTPEEIELLKEWKKNPIPKK